MSKGTLGQVVKRAISDAAFRRQLQTDPEGALKGFDLTSEERAALRSGDAAKLSGFGIDQRMSKAFAMGEGASAVTARGSIGTDLSNSDSARAAFIDQDSVDAGGARAALIDQQSADGSGARAGLIDQGAGGGRAALTDSDRLGQVNAAFEGGDRAPASAIDASGNTGREGTAYITADEAGRDVSPAAMASSDSSANTAFMTSDEMGTGVTSAHTGEGGDNASDALQPDATAPWNAYENPEHQG